MDGMEHLDKSLLVHPVWQDKSTYLNIQETTTQNSFKISTFYSYISCYTLLSPDKLSDFVSEHATRTES